MVKDSYPDGRDPVPLGEAAQEVLAEIAAKQVEHSGSLERAIDDAVHAQTEAFDMPRGPRRDEALAQANLVLDALNTIAKGRDKPH